ncbi:MAG: pteridine reductase [Gammaproteobacteria bacterium]
MSDYHTQAMNSKTVLITGAAKRIGATIARVLHGHGMNIIIHYNTSEIAANQLKETLNNIRSGSAYILQGDLLDIDSYAAMTTEALNFTGRLDVLVNNASLFYPTPFEETTQKQWNELVGTNMMAPFFLAQSCQQQLSQVNGCIINITDIYGEQPLKQHTVYSVAKAGLIMLTKAMAIELGPLIRVNAVSPGAILWPDTIDEDRKQKILSETLLQKLGTSSDIANAVYFLIDKAEYITGQVINVDGGRNN